MTVHELPGAKPDPDQVYWVRVTHRRPDGFVEFDFAIGDPELSVDLILPTPAFVEFCRTYGVRHLSEEQGRALDYEQAKWRYGQPGIVE
ncbi:phenol hydroxylase subunit [Hydrogenophaga sp. 5NK40-0174]|uniref:phenol hydroxylase subunit n=1 Tax=Hydrogenophaga sp. 5NK40-0174 TaxID=3127649 RepID=UPI0031046BD4